MVFSINHKKHFLILLIITIFTTITYSQVDSTRLKDNALVFSPNVHSIQIDATSIILMNQIGGEFDFDIFNLKNKNVCIGTRVGIEHYYLNNFVDKYYGSPFTNYNLYTRINSMTDDLSISCLVGITYYTSDDVNYLPSKYLFRTGFEIKYGTTVGILLKGSTSLIKDTSFLGVGVYLGYSHN
ncbi:MAG: hypothetical protein KKG93_11865 [Bacteroidetes bacterium]|nr:hypothetical protein [Bacteroidota bacterium]